MMRHAEGIVHVPFFRIVQWTAGLLGLLALGLAAYCWAADAAAPGASEPQTQGTTTTVRIGTYDSRAVTVAYVRSRRAAKELNILKEQAAQAKKSGDEKRFAALNEQGASLQIRRNLQGFSNAPVHDILQAISDKLPELAQKNKIVAITRETDFHDSSVNLVDVTGDLVKLFEPDDKTLKIIAEMSRQKPLPIEQVARMPAGG